MDKKTFWEGKMIDATGRVGIIKIDPGEQGKGKWEVEISDRKQGIKLQGTVELNESKEGLTAKARIADEKNGTGEWEAKLTFSDAGNYARAAALGEYRSSGEGKGLPLQHGVMVLWKFS